MLWDQADYYVYKATYTRSSNSWSSAQRLGNGFNPNPFNPVTRIQYSLAEAGEVSLKVYDLLGREVAIGVNQHQPPGNYEVVFDASHLASGIYIYRFEAGSFVASKKLVLIR